MPKKEEVEQWKDTIRQRYENYLKTSFYFRDSELRASFRSALQGDTLLKGPFPEKARNFRADANAQELAEQCFPGKSGELLPALREGALYGHQDRAIRVTQTDQQNIVVATGTASGKTESFLYPILFALYRQYLDRRLDEPGVRAMILYPMNALANDQRQRLGEICKCLQEEKSGFAPTFGQYIGQTPESKKYRWRNARTREEECLPGELVFRDEMRDTPPHILLTNYSMLEYLLIRPSDSRLFDGDRGRHWQFIVLDEAHQYRGAKGMEMGMLIRRLKQRLRDGGRKDSDSFRCIATSATIASGEGMEDKKAVAKFAGELFGEQFSTHGVIFGEYDDRQVQSQEIRRFHMFVRALEGAFLIHKDGKDDVILNRKKTEVEDRPDANPLEIALCKECGQHYYVGHVNSLKTGKLMEAARDPSQPDFGVDYYLPLKEEAQHSHFLCRHCGALSDTKPDCECDATIPVKKCEPRKDHRDQIKECKACTYRRGGIGDPVQEIVHGSDGPNAVIATALHGLLPKEGRKVLAFADSRQEAAFFAWYAEDSYAELRDRNLILRALRAHQIGIEGLSIEDLINRLAKQWDRAGIFGESQTGEDKNKAVLTAILREALTDERRLSLSGVGLVKWFVGIPRNLQLPDLMQESPWNLTNEEARQLLHYLLDTFRFQRALALPNYAFTPIWSAVSPMRYQHAFGQGRPGNRQNVGEWGGPQSAVVKHFLSRVLAGSGLSDEEMRQNAISLMKKVWDAIREFDRDREEADRILLSAGRDGTFRLNSRWLRIKSAREDDVFQCDVCAGLSVYNIRKVCPRNRCPGKLVPADQQRISENHYRVLYESPDLPPTMRAEEHTAQIESDIARERQDKFKKGDIHLLSSSTTFEVGVDLGDLEVVFLRNVPPEPFNYIQRAGRAGRREKPGLVLTYCRRNPHDLYHYEDPEARVIKGKVRPPRLRMTNDKIISRHMTAVALSAFFKDKQNEGRFTEVETFVGDWGSPRAVSDFKQFCESSKALKESLLRVVPPDMHEKTKLVDVDNGWIEIIAGPDSRLALAEEEVCSDYRLMSKEMNRFEQEKPDKWRRKSDQLENRIKTIATEKTLNFLSRKAIIPKYGFPVDVVELDTHPGNKREANKVSLQRDLSQAIAEYAPGGKVVANKKEWESCGVKTIPAKQFPIKHYAYDDAHNFQQWNEGGNSPLSPSATGGKYLSPVFGFVTPLFEPPKEPSGRARRLYTTRPFFRGFDNNTQPEATNMLGIGVTKALPGSLVILCEGRKRNGFYICRACGTHMAEKDKSHKTPTGSSCSGSLEQFSLGHELVTDIVRLRFPQLTDQWDAYSLAYAILLGAAETLDIPSADLNTTITSGAEIGEVAVVLYDNVPGGAGLVAQLEQEETLRKMLDNARERVQGACGCDLSCYGCLRSYRNQFAHPHLDRNRALKFLERALGQAEI